MIVLIIGSVTSLIYSHTQWVIKNEIQEDLHNYAENLSSLLERSISVHSENLRARVIQSDLAELVEQLNDEANDAEQVRQSAITKLHEITQGDFRYQEVHLVDHQGAVLSSTGSQQVGKPIFRSPSLLNALGTGLTRPLYDREKLFLSHQITAENGNVMGFLSVNFNLDWLTELLATIRPVHENAGVFLGILEVDNPTAPVVYLAQNRPESSRNQQIDAAMRRAIAGETGYLHIRRSKEDEPGFVFFRPSGLGDWGLVSHMDLRAVFAPTRQVLWVTIFIGVLLAVISVLLSTHILRRLLSPLNQLSHAVESVKAGDYSVQFGEVRDNQMGKLIRGFTLMVDTIRANQRHLEETVARRTAELEASKEQLSSLVSGFAQQTDLMEQDLRQAELIQRALLPRQPPEVRTVSLSALYVPGKRVGGDLYDVFRIDEQHIGLVVADATGHGVSAAMLSVLFKNRLDLIETHDRIYEHSSEFPRVRAAQQLRTHSAIPVFEKVNNELVSDVVGSSMFVSAVFGILNEETRALTITNAGHPPVLLLRATGDWELIKSAGSALGLNPDMQFEERMVFLEEGDCVLMYTDGLLSLNDQTPVTIEAVVDRLMERQSNGNILNELVNEFARGRTTDDLDDITLLMIDVREGLNEFSNQFENPLPDIEVEQPNTTNDLTETRVEVAIEDSMIYLVFIGRITWVKGESVMLSLQEAIRRHRGIVLDLSGCLYLDSAMLGTLHETAHECSNLGLVLHIQGVPQSIYDEFVELGMIDVLGFVRDTKVDVPIELRTLSGAAQEMNTTQEWLLRAHQVLAALNEANEAEFKDVISELREGLDSVEKSRQQN